jgi:Tfp pilus assembly PilM family ATPase
MVSFFKNQMSSRVCLLNRGAKCCPIGVDICDGAVKMVQLGREDSHISLLAGGHRNRPDDIEFGSGRWQRWAVKAICDLADNERFRGRDVVAAMPAQQVFIEHMRMPRTAAGAASQEKLQEILFSKIKQRLPFAPDDTMIRYIPAEDGNVVAIAVQRKIVDRHLAIYENANLNIRSIAIWPVALLNSYTSFFGRREADVGAVVMLIEIDSNHTRLVICRHKNLLFARSVPIGACHLDNDESVTRLVVELTACKRQFVSMYKNVHLERLIFLAAQAAQTACAAIARQLEMPAQIGDCLAAVKIPSPSSLGIDRRNSQHSWATAFGLSLS